MKHFAIKLKQIFISYLLIAIGTIITYTLINWTFFIKTSLFSVNEEIINLFAPLVIPGIPVLIWLRPRIKLLNLSNRSGKGDPLGAYIVVAWIAIAIPTTVTQQYIATATGKLTKLEHIGQINVRPQTKYYTLKQCYIDKKLVCVKSTFKVSGKHDEYFDMTLYAPCPIFDRDYNTNNFKHNLSPSDTGINKALIVLNNHVISKDSVSKLSQDAIQSVTVLKNKAALALYGTAAANGVIIIKTKDTYSGIAIWDANASKTPVAWLAVKYTKSISNHLSADEKESNYKDFTKDCQQDFDNKVLNDFVYLDKIGTSTDLRNYTAAVKEKIGFSTEPIIILSPVNEPFEARNGDKLEWIFGSLGIGAAVFLISLLFKPLRDDWEETDVKSDKALSLADFDLIFPREGYYVTPIIIDLNIVIFVIMVCAGLGFISFEAPDLLKWGGNYRPATLSGQYWRLLTNIFLHGGLMHVLFNMFGLMSVGVFLEPVIGGRKFAFTYLLTGIVASLASIWWHPATVSIGASGAIFGMYGIFLALLTTSLFPSDFKKAFLISSLIFIGYNLLYGLTGGIDNAAHIGGLVSGLLCGYALYPTLKERSDKLKAEEDTQHFLSNLSKKPRIKVVQNRVDFKM